MAHSRRMVCWARSGAIIVRGVSSARVWISGLRRDASEQAMWPRWVSGTKPRKIGSSVQCKWRIYLDRVRDCESWLTQRLCGGTRIHALQVSAPAGSQPALCSMHGRPSFQARGRQYQPLTSAAEGTADAPEGGGSGATRVREWRCSESSRPWW